MTKSVGKLRISSHLLEKSLMEIFIFCAVNYTVTKFSMLASFMSYLGNKSEDYNKTLKEIIVNPKGVLNTQI